MTQEISYWQKKAVNGAYKSEGLERFLKEENDPLLQIFITTQLLIISDNSQIPLLQIKDYKDATTLFDKLCDKYKFDSKVIYFKDV